jgi:hypothetical protein
LSLLLEASTNITIRDNEGLNVLHHAAYAGDAPILIKAEDKAGLNAIHHNLRGWNASCKVIG